ncbi:MAG TPA: hypothetical protein VKB51_02800 [bacterium]|nr:hypothetical protein [bacterium]
MTEKSEKKTEYPALFASSEAGTLAFERGSLDGEIAAALEIVRQIRGDYKQHAAIVEGLRGIEDKLVELRVSKLDETQARAQLDELMRVPLGEQHLRLEAFRKSNTQAKVRSEEEYLAAVRKMVRNTLSNAALLLLHHPENPVLTKLIDDLKGLDLEDYRALRGHMAALAKSHQLWQYNEKKKAFLVEWLKPFQGQLGKPIEEMTEEEFQAALHQVEQLRTTRLEEMTHLMVDSDRAPFRVYNRTMNPLVNGRDESFWGGAEPRDEFIALLNRLITRFCFNLEDRYLVFRSKDGGFCYLVGFSDEAFEQATTTQDGRLALYPHLKVFVKNNDDQYAELTMEFYNRNPRLYYNALKTSVVPFLRAAAIMVETELSPSIKGAFDMWT